MSPEARRRHAARTDGGFQAPGQVKSERIEAFLNRLQSLPPAHCGLEAYRQLTEVLNAVEDEAWGREHWFPPRSFEPGIETERIYPISAESFFDVTQFPGVMLLKSKKELVFLSRFGAIEIRRKRHPASDRDATSHGGMTSVLFQKCDAYGDGVWHDKNRQ